MCSDINEELGVNITRSVDRPINLSLHVSFGIATTCKSRREHDKLKTTPVEKSVVSGKSVKSIPIPIFYHLPFIFL